MGGGREGEVKEVNKKDDQKAKLYLCTTTVKTYGRYLGYGSLLNFSFIYQSLKLTCMYVV